MTDWMERLPAAVRIVEVGPRDGLQNESAILATTDKVRFIEMLADAGLREIEAASFVSPRRVPQLADAEEVAAALAPREGVVWSALVPNERGLDRALAAGFPRIALFTAATDSFCQRNIGMTVRESLALFRRLAARAREAGVQVRGYVSTAFVCPFEGRVTPVRALEVARELLAMGAYEASLGDTIGRAVPTDVARLIAALPCDVPLDRLAFHFHDTRGAAAANVLAALQEGAAVFDSAAGGAGGCPFAPGAAGNLATEDLVCLLEGMGIRTGVDLAAVAAASRFLESRLGHPLPSRVLQSLPASPGP